MSMLLTLSLSAIFGDMSSGLSQVILVIGLGNSCSQPLLEKRPS